MINKKSIKIDTIYFCIVIALLLLTSLFNKTLGYNNLIVSITTTLLLISISILFIIFSLKNIEKLNLFNIIIPVLYFIIFYLIYISQLFDFAEKTGAHNNVCMVFEFTMAAKYLICLSRFFELRSRNNTYSINYNSLNSSINFYKFFYYIAIIIFIGSIIAAIFNTVYPVIDVSIPYQIIFQGKSLSEIMQ